MRLGIITHNYVDPKEGSKNAGILIYQLVHKLAKKTPTFVLPVAQHIRQPLASWSPPDPRSIVAFHRLLRDGTNAGREFVAKHKIDYLLAMWAIPSGLIAYRIHKELGLPYAVFSLGSDINYYSRIPILRQMIRTSLMKANMRFANSQTLASRVTKLTHLPCNFVPTGTDFPIAGITPVTLNKKQFHFLFVGRLEKVKGIDILLEASSILRTHLSHFQVHIIGDGSLRTWLTKEIIRRNLSPVVHLLGNRDQPDVARHMLGADCLVIPSRSENLPLVLGESAKCKLPIISTNVGVCSLIRRNHAGLVVPTGDTKAFARAMRLIAIKGRRVKQTYAPGLKEIAKQFDPDIAPKMILHALTYSMARPLHVAIMTQTFPLSPTDGTAHFMYDFVRGFTRLGHSVSLFVPFHPDLKPGLFGKVRITQFRYIYPTRFHLLGFGRTLPNDQNIPWFVYLLTPLYLLFGTIALIRLVRKDRIDLINAHWIIPNGFCAGIASRVTGIPLVITLPGTDVYLSQTNPLARVMARVAVASARRIISNSPQLLKDLGVTGSVISYGVPVAREYRKKHMLMHIATGGRRVEKKGIELVQSVCPNIEILSGFSIKAFRKKLLGVDIFIAFSIRDRSGNLDDASLTVLEAMAAGCAVVASDLPGYRRIIDDGTDGILVPPGNKKALADAINKLRRSKMLRLRLGRAAQKTIAKRFTPRTIALRYLSLFRRAIAT